MELWVLGLGLPQGKGFRVGVQKLRFGSSGKTKVF